MKEQGRKKSRKVIDIIRFDGKREQERSHLISYVFLPLSWKRQLGQIPSFFSFFPLTGRRTKNEERRRKKEEAKAEAEARRSRPTKKLQE
jgi:hypothetical protein